MLVATKPKSIERLEHYAVRIGALIKIESTERGYRLLIDSKADLVLDEMLVGYVEEEVGLSLGDDEQAANPAWRRLGIVMGYREVED